MFVYMENIVIPVNQNSLPVYLSPCTGVVVYITSYFYLWERIHHQQQLYQNTFTGSSTHVNSQF